MQPIIEPGTTCRRCSHTKDEHKPRGRCLSNECKCWRYEPQLTPEEAKKWELESLARVYERILSWPCPQCGKPYPCECDLREDIDGNDESAKPVTGTESPSADQSANDKLWVALDALFAAQHNVIIATQLAELLNVNPRTVQQRCQAIGAVNAGRAYLLIRSEVEQIVSEMQNPMKRGRKARNMVGTKAGDSQ